MLKGVMVGFGIMLASLVIPIVHYVAAPLSPFNAGFIGGGMVSWVSGSKARRRARRLARKMAKLEKEIEALKDRDPAPEDAPADAGPPFDSAI